MDEFRQRNQTPASGQFDPEVAKITGQENRAIGRQCHGDQHRHVTGKQLVGNDVEQGEKEQSMPDVCRLG